MSHFLLAFSKQTNYSFRWNKCVSTFKLFNKPCFPKKIVDQEDQFHRFCYFLFWCLFACLFAGLYVCKIIFDNVFVRSLIFKFVCLSVRLSVWLFIVCMYAFVLDTRYNCNLKLNQSHAPIYIIFKITD